MKETFKYQKGQSTVEYVLLLSVVMLFVALVFRSPLFSRMLGEDSNIFNALKDRMEYSYRYTQTGSGGGRFDAAGPQENESYSASGQSRFAGNTKAYGTP